MRRRKDTRALLSSLLWQSVLWPPFLSQRTCHIIISYHTTRVDITKTSCWSHLTSSYRWCGFSTLSRLSHSLLPSSSSAFMFVRSGLTMFVRCEPPCRSFVRGTKRNKQKQSSLILISETLCTCLQQQSTQRARNKPSEPARRPYAKERRHLACPHLRVRPVVHQGHQGIAGYLRPGQDIDRPVVVVVVVCWIEPSIDPVLSRPHRLQGAKYGRSKKQKKKQRGTRARYDKTRQVETC